MCGFMSGLHLFFFLHMASVFLLKWNPFTFRNYRKSLRRLGYTLDAFTAFIPSFSSSSWISSFLKIRNSIQLGSPAGRQLSDSGLLSGTALGSMLGLNLCRKEGGRLGQEEKLHWDTEAGRPQPIPQGTLSSLRQAPEMLSWHCQQLGRVWKGPGWVFTVSWATRIIAELQWEVT